jgi:hypothetical protein
VVSQQALHIARLNASSEKLHFFRAKESREIPPEGIKTMWSSKFLQAMRARFASWAADHNEFMEPLDHPALLMMSLRDLADLPLNPWTDERESGACAVNRPQAEPRALNAS